MDIFLSSAGWFACREVMERPLQPIVSRQCVSVHVLWQQHGHNGHCTILLDINCMQYLRNLLGTTWCFSNSICIYVFMAKQTFWWLNPHFWCLKPPWNQLVQDTIHGHLKIASKLADPGYARAALLANADPRAQQAFGVGKRPASRAKFGEFAIAKQHGDLSIEGFHQWPVEMVNIIGDMMRIWKIPCPLSTGWLIRGVAATATDKPMGKWW